VLALAFLAFAAFASFYTFPQVVIRPGSADSVGPRLQVSGVTDHPAKGKILWATVALVPEPRLLDMIDAWLREDVDAEPREDILGNVTPEENRRISKAEMDDSKLIATVVAARRLGYATSGGGATIAALLPGYPAAKVLKVGDVVTAADGTSLCLIGDLGTAITKHSPGESVTLRVTRGKSASEIVVPTTRSDDGRAVIGVEAAAVKGSPCTPSFGVKIDTARIGGPSAGLAMTLALLDRLSTGELTGGVSVAATGTIEADGSVGPVGGVKQKTHAVKAAGAKLFLVPVDEVGQARSVAGSMKVVGVRTLDEALRALRDVGGEPLPTSGS
jgi:PDZ domain-containing protein